MPKPPGLQNNGNTCYFNATIQNLYRTMVFRKNLDFWIQNDQEPVVDEPISTESSFLDKVLGNIKKLFHNVQNVEFKKCFFFCLASLALYKAGSSRVDLLRICPKTWFAVVVLISSVSLFCWKNRVLKNFFGEGFSRLKFSECGGKVSRSVRGWWSRSDKVVLCCSGSLSYCAGHMMALPQPIYELVLERNPETLCVLFVMASSSCFLFCRLGINKVFLGFFKDFPQPDEAISVALAKLFRDIDSESGGSCHNPRSVLEAVCRRSKRFCGFRQQDSHELLRHLLDGIREEERNLKGATSLTLVDKVFGGHFRTVYTCEECSKPYCLYEAFLDISLPITLHEDTLKEIGDPDNIEGNRSLMTQMHSVEFWLKVFTRSENLGQQYLCSACNTKMTGDNYKLTCGTKQTLICDLPAILCIHVKRFRKTATDFVKANDHVDFSEYLDLRPYLTDDCRRLGESKESGVYALIGVVVHSGSLESGHYVAYIKSQADGGKGITEGNIEKFLQQKGFDWDSLKTDRIDRLETELQDIQDTAFDKAQRKKWYYCSDSFVTPVDAEDVFKQAAYLLFYERLC